MNSQMPLFADIAAPVSGPRVRSLSRSGMTHATLPPGSIYTGRQFPYVGGWPASKWRNPFTVKDYGHAGAVAEFENRLCGGPNPGGILKITCDDVRRELPGLDLWCWCTPPKPGEPYLCHAVVLLRMANG